MNILVLLKLLTYLIILFHFIKSLEINEVDPGHAVIVNKDGSYSIKKFIDTKDKKACSFERIYFSRGNDPDIYKERKKLGKFLVPQILDAIDDDIKNTIFSYIPNTSETCFYGMIEGLKDYVVDKKKKRFIGFWTIKLLL